jgi:hypothetical protein
MKTDALIKRVQPLLPNGESVIASCKVMPRGSARQLILGIAGAVAGGAGGMVASSALGRSPETEGGQGTNAFMAVTERYVLIFDLGALGRPKDLTAQLERPLISSVTKGEAKLFGQKMMEIVVHLTSGDEVGFGVAKIHRKHGDSIIAALC